ncbi:polyol transporter 5-like [Syzygium oleosum]|uniref:polyol transporter 5-like n=1 Tax=Syzygium oleosum TaxID=219896 RepID=UPI0024B9CFB3|nr:polyol transporter 5-like [Syzygium oleosum]
MIQLFQKTFGIGIILLYITRFIEKAGFMSSDEEILLTILVEVAKTICILVATLLIGKLGRRRLLLSSISGMIVSLVILRTSLVKINQIDTNHIDNLNDMKQMWVAKMCITSLFLYMASFFVGMGPVTSIFNSEVFPLKLQAQGCAIAFAVNQGASALISSIFLVLDKPMPLGGAAFSFVVVSIIAGVVFFITMPETKGWSSS